MQPEPQASRFGGLLAVVVALYDDDALSMHHHRQRKQRIFICAFAHYLAVPVLRFCLPLACNMMHRRHKACVMVSVRAHCAGRLSKLGR